MAGSGDGDISLRSLSNRMDSFERRFGTLGASLKGAQQAVEGLLLQLSKGTNRADGLHLGGPGVEHRHPHPHPSPYNSPPHHPPPYHPPPHQTPPLEESDDEDLGYGFHHEQPLHEGFSRKGEGRSYGKDRGHGYNPDQHRQQRYSYHPSIPHQQPHHRHHQFDYYDDYSPPRLVHHPPSIQPRHQPQPRQQQRYISSLLPPISIKNREPEKRKGGEKSEKSFEATIQGNPLMIDQQGVTSSTCILSLKEIPKELQLVERKKTSSEEADEPFTSQAPQESKLQVHEDFNEVNPAEESSIAEIKTYLDGYIGNLHNLETLDIRNSRLHVIPAKILMLKRLRFHRGDRLSVPIKIGKLRAIQELGCVILEKGIAKELQYLDQLKKLRVWMNKRSDFCDFLKMESNSLRSLWVSAYGNLTFLNNVSSAPMTLEKLVLNGENLDTLPKWVSSLRNLHKISFEHTELRADAIQALGALPSLLQLDLEEWSFFEENLSFGSKGFRSLKVLRCRGLARLRSLIFMQGALPCVESVHMIGLWRFQKEGMIGLDNLTCLKTVEIQELRDEFKAKNPFIGEVHSKQVHHVLSLPSGVQHVPKSRVPFQRKKLGLAIYTFDDCKELEEPHQDKGRSHDEDCKATSTRDSFILDMNSRSSSFEERGKSIHDWLMDAQRPIDFVYQPITHKHPHVPDVCDQSKSLKRNDPKLFDPGGASLEGFISLGISLNHGVISINHGHVLFDPSGTSLGGLKISSSCQRKIGKRKMWDHTFPQAEFAKDGLNSRRVLFKERWTDAGAESNEASFSSSTRTLSF